MRQEIMEKEEEINGVLLVENTDAARVQLIFQNKPEKKIRALLKSHGFRWSPIEGVWQRQLNNDGIYAANQVMAKIGDQ
jgi:hypothetical protein